MEGNGLDKGSLECLVRIGEHAFRRKGLNGTGLKPLNVVKYFLKGPDLASLYHLEVLQSGGLISIEDNILYYKARLTERGAKMYLEMNGNRPSED